MKYKYSYLYSRHEEHSFEESGSVVSHSDVIIWIDIQTIEVLNRESQIGVCCWQLEAQLIDGMQPRVLSLQVAAGLARLGNVKWLA